MYIVRS